MPTAGSKSYRLLLLFLVSFDLMCDCSINHDQNSSVGIVTHYGLDGPGIEFRWGRDFLRGGHPASHTRGTGTFPGVKRPERGVEHLLHLAPRLRNEQSYTYMSPLDLRRLL